MNGMSSRAFSPARHPGDCLAHAAKRASVAARERDARRVATRRAVRVLCESEVSPRIPPAGYKNCL